MTRRVRSQYNRLPHGRPGPRSGSHTTKVKCSESERIYYIGNWEFFMCPWCGQPERRDPATGVVHPANLMSDEPVPRRGRLTRRPGYPGDRQ